MSSPGAALLTEARDWWAGLHMVVLCCAWILLMWAVEIVQLSHEAPAVNVHSYPI